MQMIEKDFIIVGQGIAGTSIAMRLLNLGKKILIIDAEKGQNASLVSSGIINPVTGRHFVKSWMINDLLQSALSFYTDLETTLNVDIINAVPVLRGLHSPGDENQWFVQKAKKDHDRYFGEITTDAVLRAHFKNDIAFGQVKHSYLVNMSTLIKAARNHFRQMKIYLQDTVTMDDIIMGSNIQWKDYTASAIIFAEGWRVINNPFFQYLPFSPSKGEVFICNLDNYNIDAIVKNKKFILPLSNGTWWVGSTNEWNVVDEKANPDRQNELQRYLETYFNRPYEIVEKRTGIRPATKRRRPIIGRHPNYSNVYLFNGLGTKGVSLAPYWSGRLISLITRNDKIDPEVDLQQYDF